jgi:hypothetical protein
MLYANKAAREGTLAGLNRAVQFAPENADYLLLRADLLDQAGLSGTADRKRAVELNPGKADTWIQLGLDAEARHDYSHAERYLLEASRRSRLFQPRWTLANYYFRRNSQGGFWTCTRQALELAPRDAKALFALCWRMSDDPDEILSKAIPNDRRVLRQYTEFLIQEQQLPLAEVVATRLYAGAEPADRSVLLELCDQLLSRQSVQPALAAWNALCVRKLVPFQSLQPALGISLTNGGFEAFDGRGFNWHTGSLAGVSVSFASGAAEIYFSGKQHDTTEVLWQCAPIAPAKQYLLEFEYQTSGIPPESGVRWQITADQGTGKSEMFSSRHLSSAVWKQEEIRFHTAADLRLVRIALLYSRASGVSRIQGSLLTRGMRLKLLP